MAKKLNEEKAVKVKQSDVELAIAKRMIEKESQPLK